jgi:hypothetical protein
MMINDVETSFLGVYTEGSPFTRIMTNFTNYTNFLFATTFYKQK